MAKAVQVEQSVAQLPRLAYRVEEVAEMLGVSVRTVGNLLARGELVRRKVGSCTVIPRSSLEAFLRRDHSTQDHDTEDSD